MKFKFTWGHGVIIALACFIIFICTLIFTVGFSENTFDLVTDNYYEEEINYQQEIDATNNASLLKEKPKIEIIPDSGIKITFPKEFNSINTIGKFKLIRANSQALDINKKEFDWVPSNTLFIPAKVLVKGNYTLKLYWTKEKTNYQMEIPIKWN